ncbi:MAG: PQQ-dependent sugar dehydrogenase [Verrucomicrobiota bacterium]
MQKRMLLLVLAAALLPGISLHAQNSQKPAGEAKPAQFAHMGEQTDGSFRKVVLVADKQVNGTQQDTLKDPMELAVAPDGRVFFVQRGGELMVWEPAAKQEKLLGKLNVFTGLEDGLLGLTLDPKFADNGWIYLFYGAPETAYDRNGKRIGENRVSRFTLTGEKLELASEKILLRIETQREQCCHSGGSLAFDSKGNLLASTGDNTNPFHDHTQPNGRNGFAPIDQRAGRAPWDAEKSSANANDLRGKILRIRPQPDGTYTIPPGNLFPPGTPDTRPEIYVMGNRNPFRIALDRRNGFLYWGEVGPDAGAPSDNFGPAGFDEINQARKAGFFGWPYFVADNKPYFAFDYISSEKGPLFDAAAPHNRSPYNTGIRNLPPAQPAFIYYPHAPSSKFPVVNGPGGRTAMAGPVYYFDPKLKSAHKLPREFDHTLFIYEWSRNWVIAVKLDQRDQIAGMERFCDKMTFRRPMDMELGPDGCLYMIEWGTAWSANLDTQIIRLEYTGSAPSLTKK